MAATKEMRLAWTGKAEKLVRKMSLEEKVYLMSGNIDMSDPSKMTALPTDEGMHYNIVPYAAGGYKDEVPPMLFCDGPRGVVCGNDETTCFPVSMCRGATFDTDLEEKVGHVIGEEVRAFGGNLFAGVCINLPYNPGWGRSQETYGEDSFAIGQMGAALTRGVQDENVIACVKHFAFNSMENSRFKVSVECDRRTEREIYLSHFKDCVDAGAASVMSAYNRYQGVHCGHSDYLLNKVLKEEWDFDGFVMSDFVFGVRDTVAAANGGMDIEMMGTMHFGDKLVKAVKDGLVDERKIDAACVRIVRTLLAFEDAYQKSGKKGKKVCPEHLAIARKVAEEGITLLRNEGKVLPFDKGVKKLAVVGKLADTACIGDHGSSQVHDTAVVTPLQGLKALLPETEILFADGSDAEKAAQLAAQADAAVFVVGFDHDDEGEYISGEQFGTEDAGGDRKEGLSLHKEDIVLLEKAGAVNPNTAAVLIGGNTITLEGLEKVPAVLMAYYPGHEGGSVIADILFGKVNPSGKLPFVLPVSGDDLPKVSWITNNQYYVYDHGYQKLDHEGIAPALPYGFGLSYTTFAFSDAAFAFDGKQLTASCTVKNIGDRAGDTVAQFYVGFPDAPVYRPVKALRGFKRVGLAPGEEKKVVITCPAEKLCWYNPGHGWQLDKGRINCYIGSSEADADLLAGSVLAD